VAEFIIRLEGSLLTGVSQPRKRRFEELLSLVVFLARHLQLEGQQLWSSLESALALLLSSGRRTATCPFEEAYDSGVQS